MVRKGLDESLEKLQLKYLDLFLIHWPMGYKVKFSKINQNFFTSNLEVKKFYAHLEALNDI